MALFKPLGSVPRPRSRFLAAAALIGALLTLVTPFFSAGAMAAASAPPDVLTVRIPAPGGPHDTSHRYFADLLEEVLTRTAGRHGPAQVALVDTEASQDRTLRQLEQATLIDTYWVGTSTSRESALRPVRVPLTGGLLGIRVPVILPSRIADFAAVRSVDDLRRFTACQGSQWPDSDILEANGLRVLRIIQFRLMYDMLRAGRCDYFPRGLNEVYAEVDALPPGQFVAYDRLLIAYRFPMYFFTATTATALAERLESGLRQMATSGDLKRFMEQHPVTRAAFPLEKYQTSHLLLLSNPTLPPQPPETASGLWLPFPGIPDRHDFRTLPPQTAAPP